MNLPHILRKLFSSPILFVALGYLAAIASLLAQDAVLRGDLIPGSTSSDLLAVTIVPLTFFGPAIGAGLGVRNVLIRRRLGESALGLLASSPLLLLWALALVRSIRYGMLAA
jgi:hypothetical protein